MKSKNILIRLIDFKISILTKLKNILMSCVIIFGSLSLSGCYTQLAMFHPELQNDDSEEFQSYSVARVRPNLSLYANDGAGQSLGMAYQLMYNRFYGGYGNGYYNKYDYYNRYGYVPIHNIFVYDPKSRSWEIWIPGIQEKKQRTWTTDRSGNTTTNLTTTRSSNTSQSSNSGYSNSSNVSSTRSSSGGSSSSSSSSNSRTRVTKRN